MYSDDGDGYFPRIQSSDGSGDWKVISRQEVRFYPQALNPYISMGRGKQMGIVYQQRTAER